MINRTKLLSMTVCAALSAALLTGCGGGAASQASSAASAPAASSAASTSAAEPENGSAALDNAYSTLEAANPISNPFAIDAMSIEFDFGLKAEDVAAYKGVKSNDNGDAGLVLVVQAASGKAQAVVDAMKDYQQTLINTCSNYPDDFAQALENANNAIITSKGDLVAMVVNSNECTADLSATVDSALNG